MVVYSGMFRTQVQIWFQLEFPCNVPNLIKLMRVFSSNSNGIPCFCARILSSAVHLGRQGEHWEQEVRLHPGCSLHSRTLIKELSRQIASPACLPHALPSPAPQFFLFIGTVRDLNLGMQG